MSDSAVLCFSLTRCCSSETQASPQCLVLTCDSWEQGCLGLTSTQPAHGLQTARTESRRSSFFPSSLSFLFSPSPTCWRSLTPACEVFRLAQAAVLMGFALIKYCNSNIFYGDQGKRKSEIMVLFSVSMIPESREHSCLSMLLLCFTTEALCSCVSSFSLEPPYLPRNFSLGWVTDWSILQQP